MGKKKYRKLKTLDEIKMELHIDDSAVVEERNALITYWRTQCLIARDTIEELRETISSIAVTEKP